MTRRLRVALVDDEPLARKRLVRLLEGMPAVEVAGVHESAESLLAQLEAEEIDALVLDVRLGELSGIELHALLGDRAPAVVYVTAHAEHAVGAFELAATDYLLKPVDAGRLARALDRVRRRVGVEAATPAIPTILDARVPVETRAGIVLLDARDIACAIFDGCLVEIRSISGHRHLADNALGQLERRLAPHGFVRVHRRALVNLAAVERLVPTAHGGYVAELRGGAAVPVSRQSARRLRRTLGLS